VIEPFLKWAGGKRWLVQAYPDLLPKQFKTYFEPFLGSGALFFYLTPKRAILADSNAELINAYRKVKDVPGQVNRRLKHYQRLHSHRFYYRTRKNIPEDPVERATRFIYLNRTCFNGLYRVNREGIFNVPMGSKTLIAYPEGYLAEVGGALRHVTLRVSDFAAVIGQARKGDFVYVDPPYTVMHNTNNFIKYNSNLFSWDDQIRLAYAIKSADKRGALIMMSNADNKFVRNLYFDFGIHYRVGRRSNLASDPQYRGNATELVVTNYE
jgi:DNA adenine methylase